MTPQEAADLAARTLEAIPTKGYGFRWALHAAADRERVASDLAGLREHRRIVWGNDEWCDVCGDSTPGLCPDAARYLDGLRRTAALYGVTE